MKLHLSSIRKTFIPFTSLSLCSLHSPDMAASSCTSNQDSAPEHHQPIMSLPSNFKPHFSLRSADVSAIRATLLRPVLLQLFI